MSSSQSGQAENGSESRDDGEVVITIEELENAVLLPPEERRKSAENFSRIIKSVDDTNERLNLLFVQYMDGSYVGESGVRVVSEQAAWKLVNNERVAVHILHEIGTPEALAEAQAITRQIEESTSKLKALLDSKRSRKLEAPRISQKEFQIACYQNSVSGGSVLQRVLAIATSLSQEENERLQMRIRELPTAQPLPEYFDEETLEGYMQRGRQIDDGLVAILETFDHPEVPVLIATIREKTDVVERIVRNLLAKKATSPTESTPTVTLERDYARMLEALKKSLTEKAEHTPIMLDVDDIWNLWNTAYCDVVMFEESQGFRHGGGGHAVQDTSVFGGAIGAKIQSLIVESIGVQFSLDDAASLAVAMRRTVQEMKVGEKPIPGDDRRKVVERYTSAIDRFAKSIGIAYAGKRFIPRFTFHELIVRKGDDQRKSLQGMFENALRGIAARRQLQVAFDEIAKKGSQNEARLSTLVDDEQLAEYIRRERVFVEAELRKCSGKVPSDALRTIQNTMARFRSTVEREAQSGMTHPRSANNLQRKEGLDALLDMETIAIKYQIISHRALNILTKKDIERWRAMEQDQMQSLAESVFAAMNECDRRALAEIENCEKSGFNAEAAERIGKIVSETCTSLRRMNHWYPTEVAAALRRECNALLNDQLHEMQQPKTRERSTAALREAAMVACAVQKRMASSAALKDMFGMIEDGVKIILAERPCTEAELCDARAVLEKDIEHMCVHHAGRSSVLRPEAIQNVIDVFFQYVDKALSEMGIVSGTREQNEIPPGMTVERARLLLRLRAKQVEHYSPFFESNMVQERVEGEARYGSGFDDALIEFDKFQASQNLALSTACSWSSFQQSAAALNRANVDITGGSLSRNGDTYQARFLRAHDAAIEGTLAAGKEFYEEVMAEQKTKKNRLGPSRDQLREVLRQKLLETTDPKTDFEVKTVQYIRKVLLDTLRLYCPSTLASEGEIEDLHAAIGLLNKQSVFAFRVAYKDDDANQASIQKIEAGLEESLQYTIGWAKAQLATEQKSKYVTIGNFKVRNAPPELKTVRSLQIPVRAAETARYMMSGFSDERLREKRECLRKYGMHIETPISQFESASSRIALRYTGIMTPELYSKMCDEVSAEFEVMKAAYKRYKHEPWVAKNLQDNEEGLALRREAGLAALRRRGQLAEGKGIPIAHVGERICSRTQALEILQSGGQEMKDFWKMFEMKVTDWTQLLAQELRSEDEIRELGLIIEHEIRSSCFNVRSLKGLGILPLADGIDEEQLKKFQAAAIAETTAVITEVLEEFRAKVKMQKPDAPRNADARSAVFASRVACAQFLNPERSKEIMMSQVAFEKIHGERNVQEVLEELGNRVLGIFSGIRFFELSKEQLSEYAQSMRTAVEEMQQLIRTRFPGSETEKFIETQTAPFTPVIDAVEHYVEPDVSGVVRLPGMSVVDALRSAMRTMNKRDVPQAVHDAINTLCSTTAPWQFSSIEQINNLEVLIEQHIRQLYYNSPDVRTSRSEMEIADAYVQEHVMKVLSQAFEECRTMFKRAQSEYRLIESDKAFSDLQSCDVSKGLPRKIFAAVLCAASANADRELGVPVNHSYLGVLRQRLLQGESMVTKSNEFVEKGAWLFGRGMAIDAIAGASHREGLPSEEPIAMRSREVNIRHCEEAIQMILRKCMPNYPKAADLTLQQMASGEYVAREPEGCDEWGVSRDAIVADIISAIQRVSVACRTSKKKRVPRDRHEQFVSSEKNVIESVKYFAKTYLPEKIVSAASIIALSGYMEEASFSWSQSVKYDGADDSIVSSIQTRFDHAYREVLTQWIDLMKQRQDAYRNRTYPIIVIPDPAQKKVQQPETSLQRENVAEEFWKAKLSRVVAEAAEFVAEGSLKEGAYFASRTQREQIERDLSSFFAVLEHRLYQVIEGACTASRGTLPGVPATDLMNDGIRQVFSSMSIPDGLGNLFKDQLELMRMQMEEYYVDPHDVPARLANVMRLKDAPEGEWKASLQKLFQKQEGAQEQISLERLLEAATPVKCRCTAAFARAMLLESLKGKSPEEPIPEEVFSISWIERIHGAVSRSIDDYITREPRRDTFVEDAMNNLFRKTRQLALIGRIGAVLSQTFGSGEGVPVPENVILRMRGITDLDMLSGPSPDLETLRGEILKLAGRTEALPLLETERMTIDQFLYQSLRHDGGTAEDQLTNLLPLLEGVARTINSRCHMGHAQRSGDDLYEHMQSRASDILEELILSHEVRQVEAAQGPDAARLIALQTENDAWIASWPEMARGSDAHAGFLQVVTYWNGNAKAAAEKCRLSIELRPQELSSAILDAECVRDTREKKIVVLRENGGTRKAGMTVQHHKIRALLDARSAKDIALRTSGSSEIDPRAVSVVTEIHALSAELSALERTLGSTDADLQERESAATILAEKRSVLADAENLVREYDAMIQEGAEEYGDAMRMLPHVVNALSSLVASEVAREKKLRDDLRVAEQNAGAASKNLMEYTANGGRNAERLKALSDELDTTETEVRTIQDHLTALAEENIVATLTQELEMLAAIEGAENTSDSAETTLPTNPAELAKYAKRMRTTISDQRAFAQELEDAKSAAASAAAHVQRLTALSGDRDLLSGSRASLQRRRRDIAGTLEEVRVLLHSLTTKE